MCASRPRHACHELRSCARQQLILPEYRQLAWTLTGCHIRVSTPDLRWHKQHLQKAQQLHFSCLGRRLRPWQLVWDKLLEALLFSEVPIYIKPLHVLGSCATNPLATACHSCYRAVQAVVQYLASYMVQLSGSNPCTLVSNNDKLACLQTSQLLMSCSGRKVCKVLEITAGNLLCTQQCLTTRCQVDGINDFLRCILWHESSMLHRQQACAPAQLVTTVMLQILASGSPAVTGISWRRLVLITCCAR